MYHVTIQVVYLPFYYSFTLAALWQVGVVGTVDGDLLDAALGQHQVWDVSHCTVSNHSCRVNGVLFSLGVVT